MDFFQILFYRPGLPRVFLRNFQERPAQRFRSHICRMLFFILPVIQQIVICKQDIHIRGVTGKLIAQAYMLPSRMSNTVMFLADSLVFIQTGQKDCEKRHIISKRCLPLEPIGLLQVLTNSAVISMIFVIVFYFQIVFSDRNISKHAVFIPFQVRLINFVLHFGQRISMVPFPFGTRTFCLQFGQRKYA